MNNTAHHLAKLIDSRDELSQRFAERVLLAKMSLDEAMAETQAEWHFVQRWVASSSNTQGSFNWCCDEFDLDASAVRRAIQEKRR